MAMDRLPPQNVEAEQSVLGSLLIDPDAIIKVGSFLKPEDFYRESHQIVYQAILTLHDRRQPADFVTLVDELTRQEQLDAVGGPAYLTSLINLVPTSVHVEHYGRIVERTSVMRRLINAAGEIAALAYEEREEVDEVIDQAERILFEVSQRRVTKSLTPIRDIIREYYDHIEFLVEHRDETLGVPTGFSDLDRLLGGLQPSDLIIIAARPGVGKSSLAVSMAVNAALKHNSVVAMFTLEMSAEQLVQRMISGHTGIDSQRLRLGRIEDLEWEKFTHASSTLSEAAIFIDDTPSPSPMEVRTKARRLAAEYDLDLIIIDYLQLMQSGDRRNENRVQEISYISRALKSLARELGVPVVALSQLSRAVESRQDKRPVLSDLRESGCLTGDTLVQVEDGRRIAMRDLAEQELTPRVMALNEETLKLEAMPMRRAWCTGVKPVYRLRTALGREIRASANHPFLTIEGWRRLDALRAGEDHIAAVRSWRGLGVGEATLSEEEAALLGHLLGDGCTLPRHAIQYTTSEREVAELVSELAVAVFGDAIQPRIERQMRWWQVFLSATEHLTHGTRNPVARWLDDLGAWGSRSFEKRVPAALLYQPPDVVARFLRHLWATDGTLGVFGRTKPRPIAQYATSSRGLAFDAQHLLLRLGINARVRRVPQNRRGRDQWHVMVTGRPDLLAFVDVVGVIEPRLERADAIRAFYEMRGHNTNRDVIPALAWSALVEPARRSVGMSQREMQACLGQQYCGSTLYKANLSRQRAARVGDIVQSEPLRRLSTSDVYWDRVVAIEPDGEEPVYDLEVPGHHNFVAGDLVVHNSIEQDADIVMFIYRDEMYNEDSERAHIADIIVAKHRNGPTDTISLRFDPSLTRFDDLALRSVDEDYFADDGFGLV
jgi:replicative DNA helicase